MSVQEWIASARKFIAAIVAALGVTAVALTAASDAGTVISASEWVQIAIAFLGALAVYQVANTTKS